METSNNFLLLLHLFTAAALFNPSSFFLLSLCTCFLFPLIISIWLFFHSADHLLLVSCPLPVKGQRDEQEEVAVSFSHTQSFQDHWPRCGKKWNMGLTEQVNYRKSLGPVFFYFAALVLPDPTLSGLALSSVSGFTATLISVISVLLI